MEHLQTLIAFLSQRKKEIVVAAISFFIFSVLIFPYGDLSDLVTEEISKQTRGQVFLSFDDLGLAILPPGINLSEVSVETGFMPQLKMSSLSLAPSIAGLLAFKPGFVAKAEGLFGGDVDFTYKTGKKVNDELNMQQLDLDIEQADLKKIGQIAKLPLEVRGRGDIEFKGDIDPGFAEQPNTTFTVNLQKLSIPAGTVPTPLGPLAIPTIEFNKVELEGRLVGGELLIDKGTFGEQGNDIRGTLKGKVGLSFTRAGNQVVPRFSAYKFDVDMSLTRGAEKNFGIFLSFIDKYKQLTGTGARYPISLSGTSFQSPPNIQFLRR